MRSKARISKKMPAISKTADAVPIRTNQTTEHELSAPVRDLVALLVRIAFDDIVQRRTDREEDPS
ncbi:MAG: hypothetical protein WBF97_14505 [Comamonas sp.]